METMTAEQEAKIPEYVDRWMKVATATGEVEQDDDLVLEFCNKVLERPDIKTVIWASGPYDAWQKTVRAAAAEIGETDEKTIEEAFRHFTWPSFQGQFEAAWLAYYQFRHEVLNDMDFDSDTFDIVCKMSQHGAVYPLSQHVIVTCRPTRLEVPDGINLHCDGGPAIEYPDGTKIWALNGVRVPQWLAETPEQELKPERIKELDNVEVRAQFVRKIGFERLMDQFDAEELDRAPDPEGGEYILYAMSLGADVGTWPLLKMTNPSTGTFHTEWVQQGITTVKGALEFRNGSKLTPDQLT